MTETPENSPSKPPERPGLSERNDSADVARDMIALSQWLHDARIEFSPIFVAVSRNGLKATGERLHPST
ncbi:MAG: hypothetical protein ACK4MS_02925 [Paracoccaceae bacterium]